MWFWFSLVAIIFWSGSDLFSKIGSKPEDKYSHWKMVIAVGTVMGIHAIIELSRGAEFRLSDIFTYLPVSFLYIFAMILGYIGLRYVVLSVSTPICNSSGAVAALLCFLILKEAMSGLQFVAVALVCIGIFLLSVFEKKQDDAERMQAGIVPDRKYTHSFVAIFFPVFYCIIDGLGTFADALILDRYIKEESANIAYEFTFFIMAIFALAYVVFIKKQKIKLYAEKPKLLAGVFETAGQFAYIYALGNNAIVAAPLISSYCIFSLVWARITLKEKLSWKQYLVIAIAAIGIIILGMEG
ncbi:DMT family transporter [Anaerocolumna sp. MB42-C2]|uniref:DMT family transporter n=1 Tax=Anaerocolumna sp. MB42-C2 TaxID=3070997 RepID=UPI0027E14F80|nr:DMT family transporter [Anaerocolumna sp. MB42-C2]WMJ88549.1 DMT family transporter [Anaerocolumna sp. MB42-C2]